jgi:hypothetical protein
MARLKPGTPTTVPLIIKEKAPHEAGPVNG